MTFFFGVNVLDEVFVVTELGHPKKDTQQDFAHVDKSILGILSPECWAIESFSNLYVCLHSRKAQGLRDWYTFGEALVSLLIRV